MAREGDTEDTLTGKLAELLRAEDTALADARAQFPARGKRVDVLVAIDGVRVAIEAKSGFDKKAAALDNAEGRLRARIADVAFGLCYPDGATTDSLASETLTWAVCVDPNLRDGPAWAEGDYRQFARELRGSPQLADKTDLAARILSDSLDEAVGMIPPAERVSLAKVLDLPPRKNRKSGEAEDYAPAAKRGLLVLATAMLFHNRLDSYLPHLERPPADAWPDGKVGDWPPMRLSACGASFTPRYALDEAWKAILAVDYKPIFEAARDALRTLPPTPAILSAIAAAVERCAELTTGSRHDLVGRIFHRVLDTARYDGSYYTSTPAATLLAALAIRERDVAKTNPADLRICDPACGTGTLLMAAAERIRDLAGASDDDFSRAMVEKALWGFDVNLTATHMAATTIGLLSPSTAFRNMEVHRPLFGTYSEDENGNLRPDENGQAHIGSLEFLDKERHTRFADRQMTMGDMREESKRIQGEQVEGGDIREPVPMDFVIMNPPFTRDSLRHDQFPPNVERAIKEREKLVLGRLARRKATRLHSSGGAFTALAEHLLKPNNAAIALLLPAVVATSPGNLEMRRHLAERFHIELIIVSHDVNRLWFSENTSISEMLVIGRRWSKGRKPPTRVVNLTRNPATPIEAMRLAEAISGTSDAWRSHVIQEIPSVRILKGDWFAINFLAPRLAESYRALVGGSVLPVQSLSQIASVGPAGQGIRGAYEPTDLPTKDGRRALWGQDTGILQTMAAKPDAYIEPMPGKLSQADAYWSQRGRLFIPAKLRLNTARVAAVWSAQPAVGSLWIPCRLVNFDEEATEKALTVYFNSSVGLLALLGGRSNKVLSRPEFSMDALRSVPVPHFGKLGNAARDRLTQAYESLSAAPLLPLPQMDADPARQALDDAVIQAIGIDAGWAAEIRRALSEEPCVTQKRYNP